jgi:hypothetical protein
MLKESVDWFKVKKYDVYSTTFPIKDDIILLENRFFRYEIGLYLRNMLSSDMPKDAVSVNDMLKIVNKFYGEKIRQMITLKKHPSKNKLTRKTKEDTAISFGKIRRKVRSIYDNRESMILVKEADEPPSMKEEKEPSIREETSVKEEKENPHYLPQRATRRTTPTVSPRNRSARVSRTPILTHG